jgi:hypothetical protein
MVQVLLKYVLVKFMKAIGIGEGRGPFGLKGRNTLTVLSGMVEAYVYVIHITYPPHA